MSWKKMVFGEKMPDKDDPKYKERYKKAVSYTHLTLPTKA